MSLPALKCGTCRTCCLGDTIRLLPGDNPADFKTKLVDGERVVAKGRGGNCLYLGPKGCKVYTRQPLMCRSFDCRVYALNVGGLDAAKQAERMQDPGKAATLSEGRKRLALHYNGIAA